MREEEDVVLHVGDEGDMSLVAPGAKKRRGEGGGRGQEMKGERIPLK